MNPLLTLSDQSILEDGNTVVPSEGDCKAMRALAAYQLRYGAIDEAIALLLVCRRLWPSDIEGLQLLAQALMQVRHEEAAEAILAEIERLEPRKAASSQSLLMRSVMLLRKMQATEARRFFSQFLSRRRTGVS